LGILLPEKKWSILDSGIKNGGGIKINQHNFTEWPGPSRRMKKGDDRELGDVYLKTFQLLPKTRRIEKEKRKTRLPCQRREGFYNGRGEGIIKECLTKSVTLLLDTGSKTTQDTTSGLRDSLEGGSKGKEFPLQEASSGGQDKR